MSDNTPERVTNRTYRMRREAAPPSSRFAAPKHEAPRAGMRPSRFASGAQRVLFRRPRAGDDR